MPVFRIFAICIGAIVLIPLTIDVLRRLRDWEVDQILNSHKKESPWADQDHH